MSSESSQPLTHSLTLPTQRNQLIQIVVAPSVSDSQFRTAIESSLFKQWLKNLESKNGILAIGSFLLKQVLVQTSQANAVSEDKTNHASFVSMLDSHSYSIDRISSEIAYKALGGTDRHATTVALFNMLASYSRDTKLVLTLAAFALNYGEFWRFTLQINWPNPLQFSSNLPIILENSGPLKPRFDALNNLIKVMMDITRCVVELKDLPPTDISHEVPALSSTMAHIPTAVYWTVRSVLACAVQITSFTTMGYEFEKLTTETWELSTLAHKLSNILEHLRKQLATCYQFIDEKRNVKAYQMLLNLFEMIHIDNMKVLKALIYAKDDIPPLVDGSNKRRIYNESRIHETRRDSQYDVVWIPIVDHSVWWTDRIKEKFESLQSAMPRYTLYHPSLMEKAPIRFIKEVWHFKK